MKESMVVHHDLVICEPYKMYVFVIF